MTTKRNPFFLPSGFEPQEAINILETKGDNKKRHDKIKGRKRAETKLHKQAKICNKSKQPKKSTLKGQIQYGFDLAKWWGEQHE